MGQKVARMTIFGWGRTETLIESWGDPDLELGANRLHVREAFPGLDVGKRAECETVICTLTPL